MKQYIGISRDHSRSMYNIAEGAAKDFNLNIKAIQEAAKTANLDTIVSVVKCGVGHQAQVLREVVNSNVQILKPIAEHAYATDGAGTPLWDSIGELINIMSAAPDAADPKVSFLVMVITDGEENCSRAWNSKTISQKIRELQASDRWTFVFRVPRGHARTLAQLGIPAGNILEWDQTQKGILQSTSATDEAVASYFTKRATGATSTSSFFADLKTVSLKEVQNKLVDISADVKRFTVSSAEAGSQIRDFIESKATFTKGCAFYQLSKSETVQEGKEICIVHKLKGNVYSGYSARQLLGLPTSGEIKLRPGDMGDYEIYVQSTSVNRKLVGGTVVLYKKTA